MSKCLYCYKELADGEVDFHKGCCKKFFGIPEAPELPYSLDELDTLAAQVIQSQTTLTGVQAKLSLHLDRHDGSKRLTIVGLWGDYIFKPQTQSYKTLPENEDLTMHLAEIAKIKVVPHTLIRLKDGTLGYLTKRIDRSADGDKIPMEDMCQLTERQTEYKYKSSYEQIAKVIAKYSYVPLLDLTDFYEQVFFSWLVGNNDMHLKNFSLYAPKGKWGLTPAYDLLNVTLVNPKDDEELALTLNARKKRIKKADFVKAMETSGIAPKVFENIVAKYQKLLPKFNEVIDMSFLDDEDKEMYKQSIAARLKRFIAERNK
ncbi:MAG: HipA domain-containing protein [Bacteroidales bacterium]|nr:HipA domain-containing protein [Bacteroidales bacterium]